MGTENRLRVVRSASVDAAFVKALHPMMPPLVAYAPAVGPAAPQDPDRGVVASAFTFADLEAGVLEVLCDVLGVSFSVSSGSDTPVFGKVPEVKSYQDPGTGATFYASRMRVIRRRLTCAFGHARHKVCSVCFDASTLWAAEGLLAGLVLLAERLSFALATALFS